MAKKLAESANTDTPAAAAGPIALTYVGPDAESARFGELVPGRVYQETDAAFATYLVTTHPDHWERA